MSSTDVKELIKGLVVGLLVGALIAIIFKSILGFRELTSINKNIIKISEESYASGCIDAMKFTNFDIQKRNSACKTVAKQYASEIRSIMDQN